MPTAIIIATMLALTAKAQVDWENPAVLGINKLPYHATLQLPSRERECKEIVSLDGQWAFYWSPRPEACPADFWREDFDVSAWNSITVPGNWQTQGFGTPIYCMFYKLQKLRAAFPLPCRGGVRGGVSI